MKEILVKIEQIEGINVVSSRVIANELGKRQGDTLESIENILQSLVNKENGYFRFLKNKYFI